MRERIRIVPLGAAAILAASLAACGSNVPLTQTSSYPTVMQPSVASTVPSGTVYGRVTNIQLASATPQAAGQPNMLGAVVGGVAGAVLGHQIGEGSGKQAATVLGGLGGAALGSQYGGRGAAPAQAAGYLVTVQTDQGMTRTFQVSAVGDLRVGDPVRIDNGVIYRM